MMNAGQSQRSGETEDASLSATISNVTCLACGCLCDDLAVILERERIGDVQRACDQGRKWFFDRDADGPVAEAVIDGRPVETEAAIGRAVEILSRAKGPVFWGLSATSTETVRATLGLADAIGAKVILDRYESDLGRIAAFQNQGRVSSTLGEVKNRADLVIFWGADPLTTHPRHWERYSVDPVGRFVPEGRAGRTVVVVGAEPTASSTKADVFIRVSDDRDVESLTALRLLLKGRKLDRPGLPPALSELVARMKDARYGALFFQPSIGSVVRSGEGWEAASRLVRDLNEFTRFVILGMGRAGNLGGAEAAMTWQSGFLQGVDYRLGRPTPIDDAATLEEVLRGGEADAFMSVGAGSTPELSTGARSFLESLPRVVIGPKSTSEPGPAPTVAIATATTGFDAGGTVVRSDGVALPLRTVRGPRLPSEMGLIRRILDGVNAL